jgi:hypothetical protein
VTLGLAALLASCGLNVDDPWLGAEVVSLSEPPPPIHGGTLVVTRDGTRAVLADPDRSRVVAVDLGSHEVRTLSLEPGLELGRLAEDGAGHLHVVARRGGTVIEIDPASMTEVARHAVCAAPRGVAWEATTDLLHVACADGTLVSLAASGEEARRVLVAPDLRDVEVTAMGLVVSRFRSAETLLVHADGSHEPAHRLPNATLISPMSRELDQRYEPNAAIRMASSDGGLFVVHQRARIGVEAVVVGEAAPSTYSYSSRPVSNGTVTWSDPCGNAVAHTTVTSVAPDGTAMNVGMPVRRGVTPVDLAVSAEGRLALAFAGDPGGRFSAGPQVVVSSVASARRTGGMEECLPGDVRSGLPGQVISVAFAGERLIIHTRSPSTLVIEGEDPIDLGGAPVLDTGHALFHMDLGGTIACASCHPGGADDGHVWEFAATSPTRTQSLEGVVGRAPYHRRGDVPSFSRLMLDLEPQMDAPPLGAERTDALETWLRSVPLPAAGTSARPELVADGGLVFQRQGCPTCHVGELGSDRAVHTVDSGEMLTAPLAGVASRGPYLHDGSAPDLASALWLHGAALDMTSTDLTALVAYLETR